MSSRKQYKPTETVRLNTTLAICDRLHLFSTEDLQLLLMHIELELDNRFIDNALESSQEDSDEASDDGLPPWSTEDDDDCHS